MSDLENLIDAQIDNPTFWERFTNAVLELGPDLDQHSETIRKIVNRARCEDRTRLEAMTDDEMDWMVAKLRRGKPVRVYRAAPIGKLSGFRFHTNIEHAVADLPPDADRAHLLTGEIVVDAILLRLMTDGRKVIIAFPEKVKALKVVELINPNAVTAEEAAGLQRIEDAASLEESVDAVEEEVNDRVEVRETLG